MLHAQIPILCTPHTNPDPQYLSHVSASVLNTHTHRHARDERRRQKGFSSECALVHNVPELKNAARVHTKNFARNKMYQQY